MKKRSGSKIQYVIAMVLTLVLILAVVLFAGMTNYDTPAGDGVSDDGTILYGGIVFNELMLSNDGAYPDSKGQFCDYCELYNTTDTAVDLEGFEIYNEKSQLSWVFPAGSEIGPKDYLVLFFSGDTQGKYYVNLKLSKEGSQIFYLRNADGNVIDRVQTFEVSQNSVLERRSDGNLYESANISPGYSNDDTGKALFIQSRTDSDFPVRISEIMAKNTVWIRDKDGDFSDYIEITNYGNEIVDLENFTISNDLNNLYKWNFPSVELRPNESVIVFASGKDKFRAGEELHLSFNLDNEGETLYLCREGGILIDTVSYTGLASDTVFVRDPDSFMFETSDLPSPDYPNTDDGVISFLKKFTSTSNGLVINEVMTFNDSYMVQNQGQYYDWIELKNDSKEPILLSDYYITISAKNPLRQQLPSVVLDPGDVYVVYASGENKYSTDIYFHCNFKLDFEYESLYLFKPDNLGGIDYIDGCVLKNIPYGYSYGRGSDGWFVYIETPTPLDSNEDGYLRITDTPTPSVSSGVYNDSAPFFVELQGEGDIYYTVDGSIPTSDSFKYSSPILIDKTTSIKTVSYKKNQVPSAVKTYSYVFNESHTVPVLCVTADPVLLWDEEVGMCSRGIPDENGVYPTDANIYQNIELSASAELFEPDGTTFNINCGLKLFGQSNRTLDKKSFQLKFKQKYGESALYYPLFESRPEVSRYDTVVLRSGSQDYRRAMIRDELCTSLADGYMDMIAQAYKPCVLYINGEYYGLFFMREKIDEDWFSSLYNVDAESFSMIRGNGEAILGDPNGYYSLLWCARNYDLSDQSKYEYMKTIMDVESFADFIISQAFFGNRDSGNAKVYKSDLTDGKWRWILFDLDYGLADDVTYGLWFMIDPEGTGYMKKFNTDLINSLLKNNEFRDMFFTRFDYHLNNTFAEDRVTEKILELKALIEPEIRRNIDKWGYNYASWSWQVQSMIEFVTDVDGKGTSRKEQLLEEIRQIFQMDDETFDYYFGEKDENENDASF